MKRERKREKKMKKHQATIVAGIVFKAVYAVATWNEAKMLVPISAVRPPLQTVSS